jgi:2-polyprenyl-3-methyl-5-hydroxy-6-metoxy-1,4-benzoquinol methylase
VIMPSVVDHYASHLAPVYAWMAGGIDAALERGAGEIDALNLSPAPGAIAVDLGAGFGMHAIPLARLGYRVLAIDSSAELLDELRAGMGVLPIDVVSDDLSAFRRHVREQPQLILCMGDTLTHLESTEAVLRLIADAATALRSGGCFVITLRDYSQALTGEQRFIPVRSDAHRILTCFLEYSAAHVTVHDLLHEHEASGWKLRVSSYSKLRLAPDWVGNALESAGFAVRREAGLSGMVRLTARRI